MRNEMMNCDDAHRLIVRAAEGISDPALDRHLAACEACRHALDSQRIVAGLLHARPPADPRPGFSARLRARLDAEDRGGMLDLADWRMWGGTLAPLGAALALVAWLGIGAQSADGTVPGDTLAAWSQPDPDSEAAVFLQPDASPEMLIETVLTGAAAAPGGDSDVR
jgi:hypothetical protein